MKKNNIIDLFILTILSIASVSCTNVSAIGNEGNSILRGNRVVSSESKAFWYDGKAELSSYKLTQVRYGETDEGTAVLVYVAEPFSLSTNAKADFDDVKNVPVLN